MALAVFAIFFIIKLAGDTASDSKTIKIGVVIPLTGTQSFAGEGLKNALILAQEDIANQKKLGKPFKYDYKLIFEDSQLDPKLAISAANKLIDVDEVNVLLDAYAPIGNAVSSIAEKRGAPHISVAFDPKIADGKYNFILFMKPDTVSRVFLEELQKRNVKKISILRVNNSGIASVYQAIKDLSPNYGVSISSDEVFQPGEKDFKSLAMKSISSKPDEHVLLALSPEIELLTNQLNDYGVTNITTAFYFDVAQNKEVFRGLWFAGYSKLGDTNFEGRYKERFKREMTFGIPNFYDAFNIIVDTAENYNGNQKPDDNYFAEKIGEVKAFKGVLGNLSSDSDGIIDTPASIKTFTDNGTDYLSK